MKKLLIGALLTFFSVSSMAVDGYKNIKFGSTFNEIKKLKVCNFQQYYTYKNIRGVTSYSCNDFKFLGKKTTAAIAFIDGKLGKFVIVIEPTGDEVKSILEAMESKYGKPNFNNISANMKPNEKPRIEFANGSIYLTEKEYQGNSEVYITYAKPEFDAEFNKRNKESINSDI